MKILHTADWHIGQFKGPVVDGVNLRSQDTVNCLNYMIKVAEEEKPDIVCVSGDVFHQEQMLYNADGVPFAQVSSFQSKTSFNNTKYQPLGQNRELETNNTIGVTITISEIVVLDGELFNNVVSAVNKGESPVMTLDGVIEGRNGSQERITYRECIFSGDQDLQNVSTGDTLSRSYNLHCNGEVEPRSSLTI